MPQPEASADAVHRLALPPGYVLETYRIEGLLGKGGFGMTYLACEPLLDMRVAIKEMLPDGIATRIAGSTVVPQTQAQEEGFQWARQRFMEEARTLAKLNHPNIVRVQRLLEANGTAYMVMEFVEGRSFSQWMKDNPRPTEEQLRAILLPLLDGLEYVHKRDLLHRDIKPDNIFLTEEGRPVLLDFGSARADLGRTQTMTAVVSEGYSPFEQYQRKARQSPATDLYSLAGVMIRAITGETPATAIDRSEDEAMQKPVAQTHAGRCSAAFLRALDAAFAVKAKDRPQSVAEFRALLNRTDASASAKRPETTAPTVATQKKVTVRPTGNPRGEARDSMSTRRSRSFLPWLASALLSLGVGAVVFLALGGKDGHKVVSAPATPAGDYTSRESTPLVARAPSPQSPPPVPVAGSEWDRGSVGKVAQLQLPGGEVMKFCWCPAGDFMMGSHRGEENHGEDEAQVQVHFSKGFWMAQTECTQRQWEAVMESNPSDFIGSKALPVDNVRWTDAQSFIAKLNSGVSPPAGWKLALPTEAQWEYACRAGTQSVFGFGDTLTSAQANFDGSHPYGTTVEGPYLEKTCDVASYQPNAWGLHDMHGNVREWCADWYAGELPGGGDPTGPSTGLFRVVRGGTWFQNGCHCRSAYRFREDPAVHVNTLGFRLVAIPAGR